MKFSPWTSLRGWTNCAEHQRHKEYSAVIHSRIFILLGFFFILTAAELSIAAEDSADFDFDVGAFDKKPLQWGGFMEGKYEHLSSNEDSALSFPGTASSDRSTLDRAGGTLQLDGSYSVRKSSLNWLLKASASLDQQEYDDWADIFEAYLRLRPTDTTTVEAGKQSYKWGTGYAWNPAGFLNRRKDPNDPNEDLEGFITLEGTWIRSFGSIVETMAATITVLPVWDGVNDDFGRENKINLATRLYFLINNSDIDLIYFSGDSRSTRYGVDFATNIAGNFAIHAEFSWIPHATRALLLDSGEIVLQHGSSSSYLFGMRYLSELNVTTILEYYHNGSGYSDEEMADYYQLAEAAQVESELTAAGILLEKALTASRSAYGLAQPGKNYGYIRITWKEPWEIVYFTPGITGIINLDDSSWTVTPELLYTGFTNWELRLRYTQMAGNTFSEFGEKGTDSKIELRLRYFF